MFVWEGREIFSLRSYIELYGRRHRAARWVKCEARINSSGAIRFLLVEGKSNPSILDEMFKKD